MKKEIKDKLKSLKKITTELADNLEMVYGTRTCKVCGHTPEIMYKEVEKLLQQQHQKDIEKIKKWGKMLKGGANEWLVQDLLDTLKENK